MPRLPYSRPPKRGDHWDDVYPDRIEPAERRNRKPTDWKLPVAPPYDLKETMAWWRHVRSDDWWQSQMPISTGAIDAVLGTTTFRYAVNTDYKRGVKDSMKRLAWIIPDINRRALVFLNVGGGERKKGEKMITNPRFLRLEPSSEPPMIPKLCLESSWSLWARCASCGGNQFVPVSFAPVKLYSSAPPIKHEPSYDQVACYNCNHPSRNNYGGKLVEKSLIHEALKKYF